MYVCLIFARLKNKQKHQLTSFQKGIFFFKSKFSYFKVVKLKNSSHSSFHFFFLYNMSLIGLRLMFFLLLFLLLLFTFVVKSVRFIIRFNLFLRLWFFLKKRRKKNNLSLSLSLSLTISEVVDGNEWVRQKRMRQMH